MSPTMKFPDNRYLDETPFLAGSDLLAAGTSSAYEEFLAHHERYASEQSKEDLYISEEERLKDLFSKLPGQESILKSILDFCIEPRYVSDVCKKVDELQEFCRSVFTPQGLCDHLEKAGGLRKVEEKSDTHDSDYGDAETQEKDGRKVYRVAEAKETIFVTTETGKKALQAENSEKELQKVLEDDSEHIEIYKTILRTCSVESGVPTAHVDEIVSEILASKNSFLWGTHFIDKLEKNGALIWRNGWITTDLGKRTLNSM